MTVKINNELTDEKELNELYPFFTAIAREASRLEGYSDGEISIALVDDEKIKQLNNNFRGRCEITDVLSFPIDDELLGDIVISVEAARRQADEYNHSFKRELCYLVTHGLLHIFGYNHKNPGDKKQMRQKEERILSKVNLERDREE